MCASGNVQMIIITRQETNYYESLQEQHYHYNDKLQRNLHNNIILQKNVNI